MATTTTALDQAVTVYRNRRDRRQHPAGDFDNAGRWYPSADEQRPCCDGVRSPSRAWPWSYMLHCRTAGHVAALYGVDARDVRKAARQS